MSAQALGEELLGEVSEESLDVLLRSLREPYSPSTTQFGVPALDRLLDILQNPPTARPLQHQFQQTQSNQTPLPNRPPAKEKPPPVIEITGISVCSGKTQLLYCIIVVTLLPKVHYEIPLQGKEQAVVLLDLSSRFSIWRLRDLMRGYISAKCSASKTLLNEEDITLLIHTSLIHLHVFRPHSTLNLLATLSDLPTYLLAQPSSHLSVNRPLGLLAINEISAFYQQDRLDSEEADTSTINPSNTTATTSSILQTLYKALITSLHDIQLLFSAPVVATNHALSTPTNQGTGQPFLRPHLPAVWNNFCTLQMMVERDRVTKFGPGMSIEEASGENEQRWEAVIRSGFSGWVNWWGSGGWREEVREGLRALEGGGRFSFQVGSECVVVDDGQDNKAGNEEHFSS